MQAASNYSIDMLKKAAFVDEINCIKALEIEEPNKVNAKVILLREYLESRVKELEISHKKK